jgi:hypothetical protein
MANALSPSELDPVRSTSAFRELPSVSAGRGCSHRVSIVNGLSQRVGHAFISYVHEDAQQVDQLQGILEAASIQVWRDTADLWPGQDWRFMIRRAITDDALVFIACFSQNSLNRGKTFQNEELTLAIDQLRLRRPEEPWLIPVRFDECEIPDRDLGGGRTLASIQRADLFGDKYEATAKRLVTSILRILGHGSQPDQPAASARGHRVAVEVRIAQPDDSDAGLQHSVRSVVCVTASGAIGNLTASYVTDQNLGGTTSLGYAPFHTSTSAWRIRSEHLLRSLKDVIIGYTTITTEGEVQWFQWDGYDHEYDRHAPSADGSHLSALLQIKKRLANAASTDQGDHEGRPPVITWQLDANDYDQRVVDLFRQKDDIPLRQMLFELPGQAASLVSKNDSGKLDTLLDRLVSTGGLAIQFGRHWWLERVLETLVAIYELGFDTSGYERGDQATVLLWLAIVARVHALGGLAVRLRDWPAVRSLADQHPEGDSLRYDFGSWLQHAPVMAARTNLLDRPGEKETGLIARANQIARTLKALHPDRSPDSEVILSSICQFDVLGCLAVVASRKNLTPGNFFPSFARYRSRRSEPAFRQIISDPDMRHDIFRGDDRLLADALSEILRYAGKESFWYPAWDGINDKVVSSFIAEHRTATAPES